MNTVKRKKLRYVVREFLVRSTFHGTQGIVTAPALWMRLSWGVLVLAAIGMCMFQAIIITRNFMSRPIEIKEMVQATFILFLFPFF